MAYRTPYSPDVAETILQRLADGEHLAEICRGPGLPCMRTVLRWVADQEDFAEDYAIARTAAAYSYDRQAEQLIAEIKTKDDANVARAKFEILRWRAGVHAPRVFGERIDVDVGVRVDLGSLLDRRRQRVLEANRQLGLPAPEGEPE